MGAGYTGLWTALPDGGRPVVARGGAGAEVAGFGASGRNGGWCSAIFPASLRKVAASSSRDAAVQHAMNATVAEVARVVEAERIDCLLARGGYLSVARNRAQLARARAEVDGWRSWGFGEDHMPASTAQVADMVRGQSCRRDLDPALCGAGPGPAGPRPGRRRGRARRPDPRADPVTAIERGRVSTGTGPGRGRCAGHRGTPRICRATTATWCPCTRSWWPPRRFRKRSGPRRGSAAGRRSATSGTYGQRTPTDGSPSAGVAPPTTTPRIYDRVRP